MMDAGGGPGAPRIPELEGDFEILGELGRGGTAVVYLAREKELGRYVAIKLILPTYTRDEEAVSRLLREARTIGQFQHRNLVMLFGTRRLEDHGLALILQYVPGPTLRDRIREAGALPFQEVEEILGDLASALAYAHEHRIVHRDIKPENVYLDPEDRVTRLGDFGIARAWDHDSALTLPGTALGTPSYMSPEQVDGGSLDGRSDIYSLGLLGFEMLSGERPWVGDSLYSTMYKQKHEALPDLRTLRPDIPENLRLAIQGALEKRPEDRWQNADDFLGALGGGPHDPPEGGEAMPVAARVGVPVPTPFPGAGAEGEARTEDSTRGAVPGDPFPGEPEPARRSRSGPPVVASMVAIAVLLIAGVVLLGPEGTARSLVDSVAAVRTAAGDWTDWIDRNAAPAPAPVPSSPETPVQEGAAEGVPSPPPLPPPGVGGSEVGEPEVEDGAPAADRFPSRIAAVTGEEQAGRAGSPLAEPLVLQVVDSLGQGVGGVPVAFEVVSGAGFTEPSRGVTAPDGTVWTRWVLGEESGVQSVQARVSDAPELVALFRAMAEGLPSEVGADPGAEPGAEPGADAVAGNPPVDQPAEPPALEPAPPSALGIRTEVAVGGTHSCSLRSSGSAVCWGANDHGQLGDGTRSPAPRPGAAVEGGPFAVLASGLSHVCALTREGEAYCWGSNAQGQLGRSGETQSASPTRVTGGGRFVRLTAGGSHTCGLTAGGDVLCWGGNGSGQLGDGTTQWSQTPARVESEATFREISAGWQHTCGLDGQGRVLCWGSNASGQLGIGGDASPTPRPVEGGLRFQAVAAGNSHTCGVTSGGQVLCWGSNEYGQRGDGVDDAQSAPAPVGAAEAFRSVTAGALHTCALTAEGRAFCWGRNQYGQLGDGSTTDRPGPTAVEGDHRFSQLQALGSHTCGRTSSGEILCWGYNLEGQLGDGSRLNRPVPTPVRGSG